ncbi:Uncharacterised protein [Neisseria gonorrhoeae]|uniref:Uncharacterized protein n=1 Tax=Neisseria gonorrhoeae TaxID=485 RepID=A0A378VY44_NEIGO|nr:Uncharacterised protein [Neisseria gonorrhoeae]
MPPPQFAHLGLELVDCRLTVCRVLFGKCDAFLQCVIGDLVTAVFKLDFQVQAFELRNTSVCQGLVCRVFLHLQLVLVQFLPFGRLIHFGFG